MAAHAYGISQDKCTSQVSQDIAFFVTQLDDMKIFQISDW